MPGSRRARYGLPLFALALLLTKAHGTTVTYDYDELGRLISVTWSDGGLISYTLDAAGNRISTSSTSSSPGTIQLVSSSYSIGEGGGSVVLSVERANGSAGAASVTISTANGIAVAGSDYTTNSANLNWASGEVGARTFAVTILQDSVYEGTETFAANLSNVSGAILGTPTSATVSILDDDPAPAGTLQWTSSTASVGENAGPAALTASRIGGSNGAASVTCSTSNGTAIAGSDYTTTSVVLNWAHGDAANKTCSVPILNDTTAESTETFSATLSGASGATLGSPTVVTVSITDDDPATPSVPANLRTVPVDVTQDLSYTVLWNASTGSPTNYKLEESLDSGSTWPTTYTINVPATSIGFTKPNGTATYTYRVKACNAAQQCSGYSNTVAIMTLTMCGEVPC